MTALEVVLLALLGLAALVLRGTWRRLREVEDRVDDLEGSAADLPPGDRFIADVVYPKDRGPDKKMIFFGNVRRPRPFARGERDV